MDNLSGVILRAMVAAMELREILLILISLVLGIGCIHRSTFFQEVLHGP